MNGRCWPDDDLVKENVRLLAENHQVKGEWYKTRAKLRDAQTLLQEVRQFLTFPNPDLMKLKDKIRNFLAG